MGPGSPDLQVVAYGPTLFYLAGEMDISSAARFSEAIHDSVRSGGLITIDVSALGFIDGAGIRVLREAIDDMPSGCIIVHGASRTFRRLAEVVGLSDVPRLHLQACGEDPFPRSTVRAVPAADLAERFQALRDSFVTLRGEVRAVREQTRSLVESAVAVRSGVEARRAA